MRRLQVNSAAISRVIGFLIPLLLALHWPLIAYRANVEITLLALRLGLLISVCALLAIWAGAGATRSELKWTAVLCVFLLMYFAAALCGTNVTRGLHDWVRVASAIFAGFGLVRALRHEKTAIAFGVSSILASLVSCALILAEYWHYMGTRPPTYESMRIFKELVLQGSGVALNPLASAAFLFCLLGMCILPFTPVLCVSGTFVLLVVALLTGSRAPLGLLLAGSAILLILNALRSDKMANRIAGWAAIAAIAVAIPITLEQTSVSKLSSVTEGRYDVWTVGWAKFLESPLTGHGPESWKDDLFSRLPGYYKDTGALQRLKAGGYHSEYVTLLAEGGLLCFLPALVLLVLLLSDCFQITFRSGGGLWNKQLLSFTCLFFCVRASIEIPGLFGYGQDVIDYLAYMFLALVASRKALADLRVPAPQKERTESIQWQSALTSGAQ